MNNPNPFVPKGSLLEQQSQRRSRLKLAVFCVLAVSITGLVAVLIQGCKREKPSDDDTLNTPTLDTNDNATDTNISPMTEVSNPPVPVPPPVTNPPVVINPVTPVTPVPQVVSGIAPETAGSEYVIVKGDTLAKIAKKNGVTLKALEAANPGVVPTKLKIGYKLTLPAGGSASADATAPTALASDDTGGVTYTVKSGDTLSKIAKHHGTTVKAIENANGLSTTKIKVGQKLKIPAKVETETAAPVPVAPAPVDTTPAPALPPVSAPAPTTTAPAPGQ
jgi:LysM repeat protein